MADEPKKSEQLVEVSISSGEMISVEKSEDTEPPGVTFDEENLKESERNAEERKHSAYGPIDFIDHHSLKSTSSSLFFKRNLIQVYNQRNSQFVIQAKHDDENGRTGITAKVGKDGSVGLMAMRMAYTLVAALMTGFLLIFCLQVLLFLFLQLSAHMGVTEADDFESKFFLGTVFSVPLFVYSLACAMAIAAAFVSDTWNGHTFLNQVMNFQDEVATQWTAFWVFIGIPLLVAILSLFVRSDSWWSITALTWYSCVFALYCVFAVFVVYYEVQGTMVMVKRHEDLPVSENDNFFSVIKYTILFRQIQRFSGVENLQYIIDDKVVHRRRSSLSEEGSDYTAFKRNKSLYTKFTQLAFLKAWGVIVEEPRGRCRQYVIDEVRDRTPFVTSNTWSLEKLYCRSRNQRFVAVTGGPFALTSVQSKSSFVCALIGNIFIILAIASLASYLELGVGPTLFIILLSIFIMSNNVLQSVSLYKAYRAQVRRKKEDNSDDEDKVIYQVWESFRINRISDKAAWTIFVFEVVVFFIWPTITLFSVDNYAIATLFFVTGLISMVRHYFNAASVLKDIGDIGVLDEDLSNVSSRRLGEVREWDFREKARLDLIIGKISHGRRRNVWIWTFAVFVGIFCSLFLVAFQSGTSEGDRAVPEGRVVKGSQFQYTPERILPYPTCRMGNGLAIPGNEETALADYAFLARVAYTESENGIAQQWLDEWFGAGYAFDNFTMVNDYRNENDVSSAVEFKLFTFPGTGTDFAIVAIRGTSNAWDALADAQLWSAAALAQYVRAILPLGGIWTPIFENLINAVSIIESERLKEVSYYKETADFVYHVKDALTENVRITGHSLGGGLAFITGAQTRTPAIGLSGPNNKLSRKTFEPRISKKALDEFTFNIVPDRDPVPRIDDLSELYQRIHCTAPQNNPLDCHKVSRSVCEILVKCGNRPPSDGNITRPILCECFKEFDYAKPTPINEGVSIDDECKMSV
mmetsp:Transcript_10578/g.16288  ORF Transcript_10578/g.16288 Transcript_10578/m.16288 type:complete len:977 (+) Transcript_10578:110-3040(+)|eukprot:CAMPEP_0195294136 /NCGR_PEP_ID=MMETSP0707-20130614/14173_1 /TAXON_ID=33640 /ORGANISM="Asterionellopsis glacialis, Strain CCMP134" /LENGTH=976 /DNA_ID=CAMNT_0040355029 /DNA_START=26 /DNA_END=2956 /DNA_ORIENTATION=+